MPDPRDAIASGLLAGGGDLEPGTILAAYRSGIFPWPDAAGTLFWWSPDPRAILPLDGMHVSRSLQRTQRRGRFRVTVNRAYADVIAACADRSDGTWITPAIHAAYTHLHALGWAHSIEVWDGEVLAGGVYGLAIGGFFAAESMFHRVRDASKTGLAALVERLRAHGFTLFDVQLQTPHLASLGVVEIPRAEYLAHLAAATARPATF
ncbi:MAG: leucyl/phenylalanyl-tRNA--protein transferase [Deltaproteobacteria bacterium]|nr:leucyl/phenylalanyl-tRNA--protein transferase [Deltaproteobacteria bacterium]